MSYNFELYHEEPMPCMVRRRSDDQYNGCGCFSVSSKFADEICKRWNGYAAMIAAKNKALEALKRLDTMCREDARFMVTSDGRVHDFVETVIAELEEVK